ncbi:glycosyltransferase [Desemzia sp. RIT804]|uniref:glycosyltransferase n=1 Tax=Desemzia sp. RIT 804 TaxID=2810209 RepID=UPI00194E4D74|nr:glycosyltransferase [Desemzia sp. RIT 804]MBM6615957.1 glycosyltransferase [Desemzia sp. RIT 804]
MQMRVLHIMSGFGGGISSFIWNKAKSMKKNEISFDVLTYDDCSIEFIRDIKATGGNVYKMVNPKKDGWVLFWKNIDKVMSEKGPYEIVHCHISGYRAMPFSLCAKKNGIKRFAIHAHTAADETKEESKTEKLNRKLNNQMATQKVSCGIKATKHIFGEKTVDSNEVVHIPNSIDPIEYTGESDVISLKNEIIGDNRTSIIIGNVARFHYQKNHKFMVDIIEKLASKNVDFIWLFIGEGSLQDEIKLQIREKGLEQYTRFLGRRNDVNKLYKLMDVFVLPSLYEGLPTVAVETQAAGVPTILSETITKEADLGLGLVSFLPIRHTAETWANEILKSNSIIVPSDEIRVNNIREKKFSNDASAELYQAFIERKISHYEIN